MVDVPNDFSITPVEKDLAAGTRVGEYVVEDVIGRGAFGTVYRATQPVIGKRVAIKVLSRKFSADGEIVSRFVAEARAVNQIRHRHIIDIFSFGQLPDGRHYYVMELLDGETLEAFLASRGPLRVDEALPILRAIARALDAAHAKGIAHRDLKPENIFLVRDAEDMFPKLLDFGIAKLIGRDDALAHKTRTGAPIGTPFYMSPEQCRGRDVDHRTDIYSFGIVAYRMLTGTLPFDGDVIDILHHQIHSTPEPLSVRNPAVAADVDRAVLWMLAKDPADRPPALRDAMIALGDDPGVSSQRTVRAISAAGATRRRWIAPVIGLALLAGGVAVYFTFHTTDRDPPPPREVAPPPRVVEPAPPDASIALAIDASALVELRIAGAPDGTQVLLAGTVIGMTPTPLQLHRGSAIVTLVFQADGYVPISKQVSPDRDQALEVHLRKKTAAVPEVDRDLADPFKK